MAFYEDKYPDKVEKSIEFIKKHGEFNARGTCAQWSFTTDDRDITTIHSNTACHAGLNSPFRDCKTAPKGKIDYIYDHIVNYRLARDNHEPSTHMMFIDFLVNRSWLKEAYLSKNAARIWEDRVYVMDPTVDNNYLTQAMVMNRCHAENDKVLTSWVEMVKLGIEENTALMLAHTWTPRGGKKFSANVTCGHSALNGNNGVQQKVDTLSWLSKGKVRQNSYNKVLRYNRIMGALAKEDGCIASDLEKMVKGLDEPVMRWPKSPLVEYHNSHGTQLKDVDIEQLSMLSKSILEKADTTWMTQ